MRLLEPRSVEWHAPWRWSREALALVARRPAAAVLGSAGLLMLFGLALSLEPLWLRLSLVLLLPALAQAGFIRLAAAADHGAPQPLSAWLPSNREALRTLLVALLGYGSVFALIMAGLAAQAAPLASGASLLADTGWLAWVARAVTCGAASLGFAVLLIALRCWFLLPLTAFPALSLAAALRLGLQAFGRNRIALGLSTLLVLTAALLVLVLSLGVAALVLPPFVGALLYVSFREIFLGQRENAPLAAPAAAVPAPA